MMFPNDTYEIYAFAAEARSKALGAQAGIAGPFDSTREVNLRLPPYGFTGDPADHSAQFMSSNMRRHTYWTSLLDSFGL